jgi:hypothetical protein
MPPPILIRIRAASVFPNYIRIKLVLVYCQLGYLGSINILEKHLEKHHGALKSNTINFDPNGNTGAPSAC